MTKIAIMFMGIMLLTAGLAPAGQRRIAKDVKWLCYYGDDRRVLDVKGYDLLILESEGVGELSPADKNGRLCVAYMSIGEAERNRWFWPDIQNKDWVLDVNPQWPDAQLVDPRSPEWRDLVVDGVAATLIELGYDGFILDNVDTAEALLRRDPERFKGADAATADIIRALREKYPDAVIIANGGLSIVPGVADQVDAMMYEGTQSSWIDNGDDTYSYGPVSPKTKAWLAPRLARVKNAQLPILALEYVDPGDADAYKKVWDAAVKAGTSPYISVRELDVFPGSDTLPPLPEDE